MASLKIKVHDSDDVEFTFEVTMRKIELIKLRGQLKDALQKGGQYLIPHPACEFITAFDRAIAAVEKTFDGQFKGVIEL